MARYCYKEQRFQARTLALIEKINAVVEEYMREGHMLTVRQLYYQLVSKDMIPNTMQSYKVIVSVVTDGRMAGLIDWDAIEDRTRELWQRAAWPSGRSVLNVAAEGFHMNMWETQPQQCLIVIEKEALAGVMQKVCSDLDVPFLAARGYPSVSILRDVALTRLRGNDKHTTILHLGDHDPSGIDMTRDLKDRFDVFAPGGWTLKRLALNMPQVRKYNPPENPAKQTDSRFDEYAKSFGTSSWELDALPPRVLIQLVRDNVEKLIDRPAWDARLLEIEHTRNRLREVARKFKG